MWNRTPREELHGQSGASPAKMLRVATPSNIHHNHEPRIRSPLRPKQEINSLRRHIVGMVREQTADHSVDNIKSCESTIIYQIKKKGGIAPLKSASTAEVTKNDAMKRIHMKMMRATRAKGLRQFPALDSYADVINNENNETPANVNEPNKRIRTLHVPTEDKRGSSAKSVRFKIEDKSTHVPISPFPGYEIRGNAIKTGSEYSKSAPPATRRSEVQQRQAHIHTSLQLFKRRLKLNQDNYLAPNSTVRESDYIIRRIPLKLDKRIPNVTSDAPIEPRLSATNLPHRSRTPSARPPTPDKVTSARRRAMPVASGVRPVSSGSKSQNEETPERKVRFSYRLPDNLSLGKEVSFVEESEPIPSVNTYVLEEKKRKGSKMYEQATLSTHNLGVHDALTANDTSRIPVGEEGDVDQRLVKWVEESNVNNHTRKMSRLRSTSVDKDVTDHVNEPPRFLSEGDRSLTVA